MHERGRSICYHSRDYGPNWTPLGPITITNLQTQGGHNRSDEGLTFETWLIYVFNSVVYTKLPAILSH